MADRSPWWRSFVGKRRSAAREAAKEAMLAQQQASAPASASASASLPQTCTQAQPAAGPQPPAELTDAATADHALSADPGTAAEPQQPAHEKRSNSVDELEPTFSEATSRRNLRVSRSGRFKERKRVRVSLPQDDEHADKPPAKDDTGA